MAEQRTYYTLYLVDDCPFCREAANLVSSRSQEYYFRYFDWDDRILTEAKERYNHRTVPIISKFTVNGDEEVEEFIGGYTDLVEHFEREGQCQEESEE